MASSTALGSAELLFQCAERMGLHPVWVTPNGLFAVIIDGRERYINTSVSVLNTHLGANLARDKYRTRLILERHGMQNIPFAVAHTPDAAAAFLENHQSIIVKPIRGAGARDIHIIHKQNQLEQIQLDRYILEKYIPGHEVRYLLLNDEVIAVHRSDYGTSVAEDRALRRISYPRVEWDPLLINSSLRIATILGLRFAAVDFMIDTAGKAYILEVNTMPGLKWFHAPTSGPVVDVAGMLLQSTVSKLRSKEQPLYATTDYIYAKQIPLHNDTLNSVVM